MLHIIVMTHGSDAYAASNAALGEMFRKCFNELDATVNFSPYWAIMW